MLVQFVDEVCGIYFRSVYLEKAGMRLGQHVHDHDHATYIGSGSARMYVNGKAAADFEAGMVAPVLAGVSHEFEALEDGTRLTCVHNVADAETMKKRDAQS